MSPEEQIARLIRTLSRLPSLGRRSAERVAVSLIRNKRGLCDDLIQTLHEIKDQLCCCRTCGAITSQDRNPCRYCTDPERNSRIICVLEDPADLFYIEKTGAYNGRYHILDGKISPMSGSGPGEIRIGELVERIKTEDTEEILLALNADVESDATASYLVDILSRLPVKISRLALGLPAGSGVVYSDDTTLSRAIEGRQLL